MTEGIIDFHVHPFRDRAHCLNFYPEMTDLDAPAMKQQLMQAGITHICGSVLEKSQSITDFSRLRVLNQEALALKAILGDFYTPGFHIHPGFLRESCEEVERMSRLGIRLMGELVPYMHGWGELSTGSFMEILESARPCSMVCSYHTPTCLDMDSVIAAFPDIQFVAAHPGDRDRVSEHIALMRKYENLWLDLSGTGLFRLGLLKHLVSSVGADRILFGTDYPICNPMMYVHAVYFEDISDADKSRILSGNAKELLHRADL